MKIEAARRLQVTAASVELPLAMLIARKLGVKILEKSAKFGGFVRFEPNETLTPQSISSKLACIQAVQRKQ